MLNDIPQQMIPHYSQQFRCETILWVTFEEPLWTRDVVTVVLGGARCTRGLGNSEYLSSTYPVLSQGSKSFTHLIFTTILAGVIYIYEVWSMAVLNCATRFSTCYSVRSRRVGNSSLSLTTVCTRTE